MKELFDVLFPPACPVCQCPGTLCPTCIPQVHSRTRFCTHCYEASEVSACILCKESPLPVHILPPLYYYRHRERSFLHAVKYQKRTELLRVLGKQLAHMIPQNLTTWSAIIPIPSHPVQLRKRGFHVSALIARTFIRHQLITPAPVLINAVLRSASGTPQAQQAHHMRHSNIRGSYSLGHCPPLSGRVLLVDDVLTSGATVLEVARVLSPLLSETPTLLPLFRAPQWRHMMHALMIADEMGIRNT